MGFSAVPDAETRQSLPVTPAMQAALAAEGMPAQPGACTRASGPLKVLMSWGDPPRKRRAPVCRAYWLHGALTLTPRQAEELLGFDEPLVGMDFDPASGLIFEIRDAFGQLLYRLRSYGDALGQPPAGEPRIPIDRRVSAASPVVELSLLPGMLDVIRADSVRNRSNLALIAGTMGLLIGCSALLLSLIGATEPSTSMGNGGPDLAQSAGPYAAIGVAVLVASLYAIARWLTPWSAARDSEARRSTFTRGRGPVRVVAPPRVRLGPAAGGYAGNTLLWLDGRSVCSVWWGPRLSMDYATIDFSPRRGLVYEVRDIRDAVVWRHPAYRPPA